MRFDKKKNDYLKRIAKGQKFIIGNTKYIKKSRIVMFLESVIKSKDRVCLEGNNQKQVDFLAKKLVKVDPKKVHDLHMVQSSLVLPEHIVTEKGIAYLDKCPDIETRMSAVAAIAGDTEVGRSISNKEINKLRKSGIIQTPKDPGIDPKRATKKMLAAKSIKDLEKISGGLYKCPIL